MKEIFSKEYILTAAWFVLGSAIAVVAYAYSNFETRDHAKEVRDDLSKQMDRIETKLDRVIESK